MNDRYVICTRAIKENEFIAEPGLTTYLKIPVGEKPTPKHAIEQKKWFDSVQKASIWGKDSKNPANKRGDILVFIHGYNNDQAEEVMARHDQLNKDLRLQGFKGIVVSFDWPSDNKAVAYLEDRHDAKITAMRLVTDAISILAERQTPECSINIHLIGHSTGALVIREAFDDADDTKLVNNSWMVSQIILIAGDISASSMTDFNPVSESLYRHCIRLTNYSNLNDSVLKLSNVKRVGVSPRVGRVGLPENTPNKAVNVDCSEYYKILSSNQEVYQHDQDVLIGYESHSWHIGNKVFAKDLFETLIGDVDRSQISERKETGLINRFSLI
ncbi:alpha/beta hydrolase [Acinetobacter pittii]|uniref:alpha/beta hydrolase n=1 Tax=Acinetobacter pittii TaxID=48296 RepID=UPI00355BBDAB